MVIAVWVAYGNSWTRKRLKMLMGDTIVIVLLSHVLVIIVIMMFRMENLTVKLTELGLNFLAKIIIANANKMVRSVSGHHKTVEK